LSATFRIGSKEKEAELLLVLDYPETPPHNNAAEIAVREEVVKRKISYVARSESPQTKFWMKS